MKTIKPMAVVAFASVTLFGCASSDTTTDSTAMESTTMSETQTMGGKTVDDAEAVVVETEVAVPIATIPIATLSLTNTVPVEDMFEDIDNTEQYDLMELAQQSENLSTFTKLAEAAGITDDFRSDGEYTLLAPTNEAFSNLSKQELEMLLLPENKAKLVTMLQAHVLPSKVASTQFNSSQRIALSDNRYLQVSTDNNVTTIAGATILVPNVEASNGYIHVVDNIIIPSEDAVEGDFR